MIRHTALAAILLAGLLLASCDDDANDRPGSSAGAAGDSGSETGGAGGEDAETSAPCLDRPGALPRPPSGRLPCELIPPGLSL
jgi:hypothetical protein